MSIVEKTEPWSKIIICALRTSLKKDISLPEVTDILFKDPEVKKKYIYGSVIQIFIDTHSFVGEDVKFADQEKYIVGLSSSLSGWNPLMIEKNELEFAFYLMHTTLTLKEALTDERAFDRVKFLFYTFGVNPDTVTHADIQKRIDINEKLLGKEITPELKKDFYHNQLRKWSVNMLAEIDISTDAVDKEKYKLINDLRSQTTLTGLIKNLRIVGLDIDDEKLKKYKLRTHKWYKIRKILSDRTNWYFYKGNDIWQWTSIDIFQNILEGKIDDHIILAIVLWELFLGLTSDISVCLITKSTMQIFPRYINAFLDINEEKSLRFLAVFFSPQFTVWGESLMDFVKRHLSQSEINKAVSKAVTIFTGTREEFNESMRDMGVKMSDHNYALAESAWKGFLKDEKFISGYKIRAILSPKYKRKQTKPRAPRRAPQKREFPIPGKEVADLYGKKNRKLRGAKNYNVGDYAYDSRGILKMVILDRDDNLAWANVPQKLLSNLQRYGR